MLTTNVFDSFRDFCAAEGIEPETVRRLFRDDFRALELVRGLETGTITEDEFGEHFGELLEIDGPQRARGSHVRWRESRRGDAGAPCGGRGRAASAPG